MSKKIESPSQIDPSQKPVWETPEIEVLDAREAEAAPAGSGPDMGIYS